MAKTFSPFLEWFKKIVFTSSLLKKLTFLIICASILSCIATFIVMTSNTFGLEGPSRSIRIVTLLNIDLCLLGSLALLIGIRLFDLWRHWRHGLAGAKLHVRLVLLFSLLAAVPTVTMAVFSTLFFNAGVQAWFNERVRTALDESKSVAESYLAEHLNIIRSDAKELATDLRHSLPVLLSSPDLFTEVIDRQAERIALREILIVDRNFRIIAKSRFTFALEFELSQIDLERAAGEEILVKMSPAKDRVRALVEIDPDRGLYLFVGRSVDPHVLERISQTAAAVDEYHLLKEQLPRLELRFAIIFLTVAVLLLLIAVWVGLAVATQFAAPISRFIAAANQMSLGDFSVHLSEEKRNDELGSLARAFNRMTNQLALNQEQLITANTELETRQQFTESVLAGVSSGVIGLNAQGHINLPNTAASELLRIDLSAAIGTSLEDCVPEMNGLLEEAQKSLYPQIIKEINLIRQGYTQTLLVHVVIERTLSNMIHGFVVTFDDITALQSAQRKAAWADVARKIAHEIKNPLTPIQLSAERLKRRYLSEIQSNPETFNTCIDTIIRQVDHIGRLITEFSDFARMPTPIIQEENLTQLCKEAIFLQQEAHQEIIFTLKADSSSLLFPCDRGQMGQVLTNLFQNSIDSIQARHEKSLSSTTHAPKEEIGHITVTITALEAQIVLEVTDDGEGFPTEDRDRLLDPYVTKRAKGTGLGLAIVKKIIEDHKGRFSLGDGPQGAGACVRIVFNQDKL